MPTTTVTARALAQAEGPVEVLAYIDRWRPARLDALAWDPIADFVRQAVRLLRPPTTKNAQYELWTIAPFVAWAASIGTPLDRELVFTPDLVGRYCESHVRATPGTARSIRAHLTRVGPQLTRRAPWPPVRQRIPRSHLQPPYSPWELDRLEAAAHSQGTAIRRHLFEALMAIGLGCGIDGRWVSDVFGSDVVVSEHGVTVRAQNPDRSVVCLAAFEDRLAAAARRVGKGRIIGSRTAVNTLVFQLGHPTDGVRLSLGRLRSTWLLHHLTVGTPLAVLLPAAGLRTACGLTEIIRLLPAVDPELTRTLLRGGVA